MSFKDQFAALIEVEPDAVVDSARLDAFENWDSLAKVSLIALLQQTAGVVIEEDCLDRLELVGDVLRLLPSEVREPTA